MIVVVINHVCVWVIIMLTTVEVKPVALGTVTQGRRKLYYLAATNSNGTVVWGVQGKPGCRPGI